MCNIRGWSRGSGRHSQDHEFSTLHMLKTTRPVARRTLRSGRARTSSPGASRACLPDPPTRTHPQTPPRTRHESKYVPSTFVHVDYLPDAGGYRPAIELYTPSPPACQAKLPPLRGLDLDSCIFAFGPRIENDPRGNEKGGPYATRPSSVVPGRRSRRDLTRWGRGCWLPRFSCHRPWRPCG